MRLRDVGEFGLIDRLRKTTPRRAGVRLGIGDDAAWVSTPRDSLLFTSDLLIEGVHFQLRWISFYELGHKSLTASLSDIAAMGGSPAFFLLSLGLPPDLAMGRLEQFHKGMRDLAAKHRVALVGGDTCASDRLIVDVFLAGFAPYGAVSRSGARSGDDLYVTGSVGDSAMGLELLSSKDRRPRDRDSEFLIARHCRPTARLKAGGLLARERLATSMIDISDGLLQDLGHICEASGTGAVVWQESVPVSPACQRLAGARAIHYAVTGGEDYELLFSLRRRDRGRLDKIARRLGVPITRIGQCVPASKGITLAGANGDTLSTSQVGHDHFKNKPRS